MDCENGLYIGFNYQWNRFIEVLRALQWLRIEFLGN